MNGPRQREKSLGTYDKTLAGMSNRTVPGGRMLLWGVGSGSGARQHQGPFGTRRDPFLSISFKCMK